MRHRNRLDSIDEVIFFGYIASSLDQARIGVARAALRAQVVAYKKMLFATLSAVEHLENFGDGVFKKFNELQARQNR